MACAERITIAQSPATCFAGQQCINPNLISFKADRYAVFARGLDMEVRDHRPSISTIRRTCCNSSNRHRTRARAYGAGSTS